MTCGNYNLTIMSLKVLLVFIALSLSVCSSTPSIPEFTIDFDIPASTRYNEVFTHYKDQLKDMQLRFFHSVPPQFRNFFKDNLSLFRKVNDHVYDAMESLANITGLEHYETMLVNSIVDFSSFCTSIVARKADKTIIHARNLDFDFP